MPLHRRTRSRVSSRFGPLSGSSNERERQVIRRLTYAPISEVQSLLRNPSQETIKWVKSGLLTNLVLKRGNLEDLRALHSIGARFENIQWDNADRVEEWSTPHTAQWIGLLFDRGWKGKGGRPEPLLSVAEFHPSLVEQWKLHAPNSWHTRRNWLAGTLNLNSQLTPNRVKAWFYIGGTHAGADKLTLDQWFAYKKPHPYYKDILVALHDTLRDEKARRRVRGEPAFREWPWEQTRLSAVRAGALDVVEWISGLLPPPSKKDVIDWLSTTTQPLGLLAFAKQAGWRVPHPLSEDAQHLVNAVLLNQRVANSDCAITERGREMVEHLLGLRYKVNLSPETWACVEKDTFPSDLRAQLQAAQLQASSPQFRPSLPSTRRRI